MASFTPRLGALAAMLLAASASSAQMLDSSVPDRSARKDNGHGECYKECCVDLGAMIPNYIKPSLLVGDDAPPLQLAGFYKGEPIESLEEGRVYVVEFWATWCKPCIDAFPHLSEIQKKYEDDGVTVMGINVGERRQRGDTPQVVQARVASFVENQGDRMGYTVAADNRDMTNRTWKVAAGRNTLPSAIIVDRAGKIAWVGTPLMGMDQALEAIVEGTYTYEKGRGDTLFQSIAPMGLRQFMAGVASPDEAKAGEAYVLGRALAVQVFGEHPQYLHAMARLVLEHPRVRHRNPAFALVLARQAAEDEELSKDPAVLDTFALALFANGDTDGAIETQERAIALADNDRTKQMLEDRLEQFRAAP